MNRLAAAVLALLSFASPVVASPWNGKLDLQQGPKAYSGRELNDGMWLIGGKQPLWALWHDDVRTVTFGAMVLCRLEFQSPSFGFTGGLTMGGIGHGLALGLAKLGADIPSAPPFVSKLGDWVSVEGFGGYRPNSVADQHHIIYGVGGEVVIPFGQLSAWAKGSPWNGEGPNTLGL